MKDKSIGRKEQQKILEEMTAEQKLDSLENERKNVLELDPELGMRIFIEVKELIALLSNNHIPFVLIGGTALRLYNSSRATFDIDFTIY